MAAFYSPTSPYYKTEIKKDYLDFIQFRNIPYYSDDPEYELDPKYEFRPDLLAYDLYNDTRLWWVFALRNKDIIKDPIFDMVSGVVIFLPKQNTLKTELGL
jgi:hypothetical protein